MENNKRSYCKKERYMWLLPQNINNWQRRNYWYENIANSFDNFFVKIELHFASKITRSDTKFEPCISKANTKLDENALTEDEVSKAFKSLKINKAPGFDQIYNHIKKSLTRVFGDSIKFRVFPEKLKLVKVTPIFKSEKKEHFTNYRPISVLPCFSKILLRIMYNRLYEYLTKNNLLFDEQFGFRKGHSTKHDLTELATSLEQSNT